MIDRFHCLCLLIIKGQSHKILDFLFKVYTIKSVLPVGHSWFSHIVVLTVVADGASSRSPPPPSCASCTPVQLM
jgi:hypothetical protein